MKSAIEVSPQFPKRGVGIYTENLIKHLAKIDKKKSKMLYYPNQKNFSMRIFKFPDSVISLLEWKLHVPIIQKLIKKENINIYHSPGPRLPQLKGVKTIITVHDLIPEIFPKWCNTEFIKENRKAIKSADAIIVDSQNTKNDLIKIHNVDESKINVVPLGVDTNIFHPIKNTSQIENIRQKYNLPNKFILAVGPFEPRRNLEKIFEAYKKVKSKFTNLKIVLVGRINEYVRNLLDQFSLLQDVIITGYISNVDLCIIYNLAQVFIHPSFYEGFGLQVLEAMACGCPVITSNISSLPEVAGKAGVLINPKNTDELSEAISSVILDERLRIELTKKGIERAKEFSWTKTAQATIRVYKSLL